MGRQVLVSVGVLALVGVALAPVTVGGQDTAAAKTRAAAGTWSPSRTPWGDPDLQGVWSYNTLTPLQRPAPLAGREVVTDEEAAELTKRELARINGDQRAGDDVSDRDPETPDGRSDVGRAYNEFWRERGSMLTRTSLIVDPPDGRIPPLTAEGQKRRNNDERDDDGPEGRGLMERCLVWREGLPMLPSTYNSNFEIIQTPGYVTVTNEMIHETRVIPLDGRPHISANVRQWLGDSRGRWEGNTLVVETTNFTDKTKAFGSGPNLHLIERFTRDGADALTYEFTVNDPSTFTRPWTAAIPTTRIEGLVYEYACHEGNVGLYGQLSGFRSEEGKMPRPARPK